MFRLDVADVPITAARFAALDAPSNVQSLIGTLVRVEAKPFVGMRVVLFARAVPSSASLRALAPLCIIWHFKKGASGWFSPSQRVNESCAAYIHSN